MNVDTTPANVRKAVKSLSDNMLVSLVYLGRGIHRVHAMPEQRTLKALERRGLIEWSKPVLLHDAVGSARYDVTRLWDVTPLGWAVLATQGIERPADDGRLTLEEALEEANAWADRNNSDWGIGRLEDLGRLSLADALDAAYERVEPNKFTGGVTFTPVHEQRSEYIEPGTVLRNIRTGQVGVARFEHGVYGGTAWIKVRLMIGGKMSDNELGTRRWSLNNTVRVQADTARLAVLRGAAEGRLTREEARDFVRATEEAFPRLAEWKEGVLAAHSAGGTELPEGVTVNPDTHVLSGPFGLLHDLWRQNKAVLVDGNLILR